MKEFKVGDRVAAYIVNERVTGEIIGINFNPPNTFVISDSKGTTYTVHPKQCRRLITRPKEGTVHAKSMEIPEAQ
jgi:hypothetical protein